MTDVSKWELVTQPTFLKGGCWASATLNKNIRAVRRRKVYQKKNDEDITGYAVNMETWQYSDRTDIYPAFCSLFSFSQFRQTNNAGQQNKKSTLSLIFSIGFSRGKSQISATSSEHIVRCH